MKGGAQTALALGVGYILGRRRKMRTTTALALAAVTGGLGGLGPTALRRGVKLLSSTDLGDAVGPQLGQIADTVRGELLEVGKAAAAAAVSSRIESLSDNLHDRAESLRNPEGAGASGGAARRGRDSDGEGDAGRREEGGRREDRRRREDGREERRRPGRRGRARSEDDGEAAEDLADDEPEERDFDDEDEADEPTAGRDDEDDEPARGRDTEEEDEPAGGRDEEDVEEPPRRSRRTRSPVSRTRR